MKKSLFFLFLIIITELGFSQQSDIFYKIKINYSKPDDLLKLANNGVCIDHGFNKKNHFFISDFSGDDLQKISSLGFSYEILIDDVISFYQNRNKSKSNTNSNEFCDFENNDYTTPENYDIKDGNNFGGFYTYDELINELDDMFTQYPNLISQRVDLKDNNYNETPHIHETYEGRFLQMLKISDNPNVDEDEPQILYTALHHAREPASMQQLIFFMWYLLENYDSNDSIKQIIDNSELYFVPCVNPDGYIYNETSEPNGGGMWRKNRRDNHGVDNNRNYSYIDENGNEVWNSSGTSNNPNGNTYAGDQPFSEAENRAIRYLVESKNFKLALNNHTYGNLLLYPYGYDYNQLTEDNEIYEFISSELVSENNYDNIISADLYPAAGDSDDFMYGMLVTEENETREKIFAMTPEIGSSFWPQASNIESLCKGMIHLNLTAAKMIGNYATLEDNTPNFITDTNFQSSFSIKRLGIVNNGNFSVSLIPISSEIESVSSQINFSSLQIGQIAESSFEIILSESVNYGDTISYKYILNNGLFEEEILVNKIYGVPQVIIQDESDVYTNYWNDNSEWSNTYEEYFSPETSITDSPYSNYSNNSEEIIQLLSSVNLSGFSYAEINFDAKWNIESGYDYVQLEVSNDNGNSWIPQCGRYTNKGIETHDYALDEPLYDGNQSTWINESISLLDYLGEEILIRFKLYTDGGLRRDGFYFDNFKINGLSNNLNNDIIQQNFARIFPNPVENYLNIVSSKDIERITIYNILGELVLNISDVNLNIVYLNHLNKGIYLLKLTSDGFSENHIILKE